MTLEIEAKLKRDKIISDLLRNPKILAAMNRAVNAIERVTNLLDGEEYRQWRKHWVRTLEMKATWERKDNIEPLTK